MDASTAFPREVELKFDLTTEAAEAAGKLFRLWTNGGEPKVERLTATYYDTPGFALRDAGVALRVRREGDRWLQTAKSGAPGGLQRFEWESEASGDALEPGLLANTPVGDLLGKGGLAGALQPVFTVEVTRISWMLAAEGSAIEASLDVGEARAGERSCRIQELELELKAGQAGALFSLARTLAENVPITVSFTTKAERGYGLLTHADAVKADKHVVRRGMTAAGALQAIGRACLGQLSANARLLAEGGYNSDAVHQARVGMRRLRAALDLYRDDLQDRRGDELGEALRTVASALGDARNLDVFRFTPAADAPPAGAPAQADEGFASAGEAVLAGLVADRRAAAHKAALDTVGSEHLRGLLLDAVEWLETGTWLSAEALDRPVDAFAADILGAQLKKMRKRGRHLDTLDAHARHRLRIAGKKLRYGLEFFAPAAKGGTRRRYDALVKALKPLQETLGQLNDVATGDAFMADLARTAPSDAAFAAGQLSATRRAGEAKLLRELPGQWKRFKALEL